MITEFKQNLYLHAAGWTQGDRYDVKVITGDGWAAHPSPLDFHGEAGVRHTTRVCVETLLEPLPRELVKASGVARATWAAKSTVFAALLAQGLVKTVNDQPDKRGDRVGIGIVSFSAIVPIFWRFESVGLSEGWHRTDTMLLPAAIPTAVGTASSTITDSHATAITFADGALGMFNAIEHAYLGLIHDRFDYFLAMGAEEASMPILNAMTRLGVNRPVVDGAAGFVLTREKLSEGDWRIDFIETQPPGHASGVPQSWAAVPRFTVTLPDSFAAYTATLVPHALAQAISTDADAVLVELTMHGRVTARVGLTRPGTRV